MLPEFHSGSWHVSLDDSVPDHFLENKALVAAIVITVSG